MRYNEKLFTIKTVCADPKSYIITKTWILTVPAHLDFIVLYNMQSLIFAVDTISTMPHPAPIIHYMRYDDKMYSSRKPRQHKTNCIKQIKSQNWPDWFLSIVEICNCAKLWFSSQCTSYEYLHDSYVNIEMIFWIHLHFLNEQQ